MQIWKPGPGYTRGETIAWAEEKKVLFSGDLVEYEVGVSTADAQLEEWPATLDALRPLSVKALVPGGSDTGAGSPGKQPANDVL